MGFLWARTGPAREYTAPKPLTRVSELHPVENTQLQQADLHFYRIAAELHRRGLPVEPEESQRGYDLDGRLYIAQAYHVPTRRYQAPTEQDLRDVLAAIQAVSGGVRQLDRVQFAQQAALLQQRLSFYWELTQRTVHGYTGDTGFTAIALIAADDSRGRSAPSHTPWLAECRHPPLQPVNDKHEAYHRLCEAAVLAAPAWLSPEDQYRLAELGFPGGPLEVAVAIAQHNWEARRLKANTHSTAGIMDEIPALPKYPPNLIASLHHGRTPSPMPLLSSPKYYVGRQHFGYRLGPQRTDKKLTWVFHDQERQLAAAGSGHTVQITTTSSSVIPPALRAQAARDRSSWIEQAMSQLTLGTISPSGATAAFRAIRSQLVGSERQPTRSAPEHANSVEPQTTVPMTPSLTLDFPRSASLWQKNTRLRGQ